MYNPNDEIVLIPEMCSVFHDTKKDYGFDRSYRVTGFYKAVPNIFKPREDAKDWENKMMKRLFNEWHPNWYNEYRLVPCLREEATHVCGAGVAGTIACLSDKRYRFTTEMVSWSKESITEEHEGWIKRVALDRFHPAEKIVGIPHSKKRYGKISTFKGKRYQAMVEDINNKLK